MVQKTTAPTTPDPIEESSPSPIGSNYTTASESGAVDILEDQKGINDEVIAVAGCSNVLNNNCIKDNDLLFRYSPLCSCCM